jgi:phage terminase large subunit-like protein
MTDHLINAASLARWRADPIAFIERYLINPETGEPFELLPAERAFLIYAFQLDENGKLRFPELLYSCPKKSGKTTFAALIIIVMLLLFGGAYGEAFALANDREQAKGRVFEMIRRIIEASPLLRRETKITESRITFPAFNATITAIASDAASAAGANPTISCFDELWAFSSERSRRLWDEMIPPPTRKIACRLTVTYAGYEGESLLLEELHKRGKALPQVGKDLYAGDGLLMFWSHEPVAPWQDEAWLASMRATLRPSAFSRMVLNEFASSESAFVDLSAWDQCVMPDLLPLRQDADLSVWCGVDASIRRDSTALVLCTYDKQAECVRLIAHKVFTPSAGDPIDFEATIERTILEWDEKFLLRKCLFDPFQLVSVMQRLQRAGVQIEEYAQTIPNLTAATSNLLDLISARQLILYPDQQMRLAVSRAVMIESSRGFRLAKHKAQHRIDSIVALSMAALGAVKGQGESSYPSDLSWVSGPTLADPEAEAAAAARRWQEQQFNQHVLYHSGYYNARRW